MCSSRWSSVWWQAPCEVVLSVIRPHCHASSHAATACTQIKPKECPRLKIELSLVMAKRADPPQADRPNQVLHEWTPVVWGSCCKACSILPLVLYEVRGSGGQARTWGVPLH